jgi:hypothetical protein
MNILKYPDEAPPGISVTKMEFEELASEAQLAEDLMDRNDLEPDEFFHEAIDRANSRRTYNNLHLWVSFDDKAHLIATPLVPVVSRLSSLMRAQKKQTQILAATIQDLIRAGGVP